MLTCSSVSIINKLFKIKACSNMPIIIKLFKSVLGNSYGKFLGEIPRGNSILTNSHMTKKYKKSNFALVKSLVLFYGQVS